MPKATRTLSGASQEKYLRELFAAEPELTPAGAARLRALCSEEISHVRVRLPIPKRARTPALAASPSKDGAAPSAKVTDLSPAASGEVAPTAANDIEPAAAGGSEDEGAPPAASPPFDPYAFSVTALLKRGGREALRSRLGEIASADNLRQLAEIQHIALASGVSTLADIREAIVEGAERRLADRRAAAS
jgi:hypothetical protein